MERAFLSQRTPRVSLISSPFAVLLLLLLSLLPGCRRQTPPSETVNQLKLLVQATGFYQVSLAQLQQSGLAIETLNPAGLSLTENGTAVPYLIQDDTLIFYGLASDSRYTATRAYLLTGGQTGVLMGETAVSANSAIEITQLPQTLHLEENLLYEPESGNETTSDRWFWQTIGQGQQLTLPFTLPVVSDGSGMVRLHLWGFTLNPQVENDHDFEVSLNGQPLGSVSWDGKTYYTAELPIPPGLLQAGDNTLLLDNEPPGASFLDIMRLDWVELVYVAPLTAVNDHLELPANSDTLTLTGFSHTPLLFDIQNPQAPTQLVGWQPHDNGATLTLQPQIHLVAVGRNGFQQPTLTPTYPPRWRDPNHQADLIILTTAPLAEAVQPLVTARQNQGLTVAVVLVEEVYDEFGAGNATPQNIQTFLRYAVNSWSSPPRYVLLVGDASSDYHNNLGLAPQNIIPPFMVPVSFGGETVSDSQLADIDGDDLPDLAIGRWPVDSATSVASLVERTLVYEQGTAVDRVLFAADGTEEQFSLLVSQITTETNLPDDQTTLLRGPQAAELVAAWNQGAWLTTYVGHGSLALWGKEGIFTPEHVPQLQTAVPPIVLQLTCLTGLFAHPQQESLSETMLRAENGPVLLVAATSLTLSADQQPFATAFIQQLQDSAVTRVGDAFLQAKQTLNVQRPGLREISHTYTLFGDPSTLIVRP